MLLPAAQIAFFVTCAVALFGQTRTLEFEAISIKNSPPAGSGMIQGARGGPGTPDPGLFRAQNFGLMNLLEMAYEVDWYRISGPDWMKYTWFDIDAKVPPGASRQDFRVMLQNMLVERFGLKVHHEQKETAGYELVIAKGGTRFTPSTKADPQEEGDHSLTDKAAQIAPPRLDKDGFPVIPPGSAVYKRSAPGGRVTERATRRSMDTLADELSGQLSCPVKNATGLDGEYDFLWHWISPLQAGNSDDPPSGPTIFAALQQQLGLRLVATKTKIDVLVIDHVAKTPTEN